MARWSSPLLSITSIVLSQTTSAIGSGIMFAYVPFTLARGDYPGWVAGAAVTSIAAGGILGCLIAGILIRRVGHARMFAVFAALIILSAVMIALTDLAFIWLAARFLYGVAANGNFIVTQSWLNYSSDNAWRGRAMSVFYMAFVIGMGTGSFLFGVLPEGGADAPMLSVLFASLAILPIGLTRLATPPPPDRVELALAKTWATSPVGLIGIFASGGLSMLVQGFTPIYATKQGLGQTDVALLMFLMQLGMLAVQLPLGALSDRMDRRVVLAGTCVLVSMVAVSASFVPISGLLLAAMVFAVWSGSTETIYSVANAHANDRADPDDYVPLASTMLIAWSVAAFIFPLAVTALTPQLGDKTFMYMAVAGGLVTTAFVIVRIGMREPVPEAEVETFELRSAQIANAEVLLNPDEEAPNLSLPS